jgi:hypothetical protein
MARLVAAAVAVMVCVGGLMAQEFKDPVPVRVPAIPAFDVRLEQLVEPGLIRRAGFMPAGAPGAAPQPVAHPDLPADAKEMLAGFDVDADAIRKKAEEEIHQRRLRLIEELQKAQDRYTREAKLDEAVAIRDTIRRLKASRLNLRQYNGSMFEFRQLEGQPLYFEITGRTGGSIWGTDVYTGDSDLGTAAVHAGALNVGQTGIVEVVIVPSPPQHLGTTRNGVTTSGWGAYGFSYSVRKWTP